MPELRQSIRFCRADDGVRLAYSTMGKGLPLVHFRLDAYRRSERTSPLAVTVPADVTETLLAFSKRT